MTSDMCSKGKPDAEPYRRGAALLQVRPEACLVIEDAPNGVRAGKAAGCTVLGVEGTHPAEELTEAGATWVVRSLGEVRLERRGEDLLITA